MKKFLALALALVMALALAAPAMAFTSGSVADEYLPELSIDLVEVEEGDKFFGILSAAPSDRGYAKNEIVAFIVTLEVAKDQTNGDYDWLTITGENVTFDVKETNVEAGTDAKLVLRDATTYVAGLGEIKGKAKAQWLSFAKVTGDDASITAELSANGAASAAKWEDGEREFVIPTDNDEEVYGVVYYPATDTDTYFVWNEEGSLFEITTDKKGVSKALWVYDGTTCYKVLVNNAGEYIFVSDTTAGKDVLPGAADKAGKALYKKLVAIVEDEFEGFFGFDYDLLGGVVNKKYFDELLDYDKISVTVDIAPWVAYVQVPDVIVVDPPKTGDATVLVGIVMAIVAAAGVVVFNKVRA